MTTRFYKDGSVGVPPASATSTNNPSAQTWNYDNAGNWNSTAKTVGTNTTTENRTHSVADQINTIGGNAATHDLKGNLTQYKINNINYTMQYDLDNRIITVDVDNDDVEYRYDAFGRRVIRKEGSTNTSLIWWGNSECAEHKHQAGTTVIQNDIMEHPSRLNSVIARAVDGSKFKLQWYHKNYLDHVYAVSDDDGDILEHYRYTAFGEVTIYDQNGQLQNTTQIDNHILWNTRRRDEVTGYYMYKFRHYSAELGRWPSRDPIGERGGVNLYAFVGNDGINYWDYLGNEKKPQIDTSKTVVKVKFWKNKGYPFIIVCKKETNTENIPCLTLDGGGKSLRMMFDLSEKAIKRFNIVIGEDEIIKVWSPPRGEKDASYDFVGLTGEASDSGFLTKPGNEEALKKLKEKALADLLGKLYKDLEKLYLKDHKCRIIRIFETDEKTYHYEFKESGIKMW